MLKIFAVFIGGGIGTVLRYVMCNHTKCHSSFSTLLVNLIASLIIGFLFYYFAQRLHMSEELKLLLTVGFCGGLSTFSAFALENYNLLTQGEIIKSAVYIALSIILTVSAVMLGVYIAKQI